MSEPKHGPLPWRAGHLLDDQHPCNCRYIFSAADRMGAVGEVCLDDGENDCPSLEEAKANLALIVKAVNCHADLLAAAKAIVAASNDDDIRHLILCDLQAAIAKAESDTQ